MITLVNIMTDCMVSRTVRLVLCIISHHWVPQAAR